VVTKSNSNDFLFNVAKEMTQTRCGTYELDVVIGDGEQFGFYLYPLNNTSDEMTVSDIGCVREGGARCPHFATPAALEGMEQCTKAYDQGQDVFYNRIFDGQQLTYVYGSCDVSCTLPEPIGCPGTAAEDML
jgi:hypothetical protein